jgi:hypothetical protein
VASASVKTRAAQFFTFDRFCIFSVTSAAVAEREGEGIEIPKYRERIMSRFGQFLMRNAGCSSERAQRTNGFRPTLEVLESRQLLSITSGQGIVIPHVEIETVYYGQDWNQNGSQDYMSQFDNFLGSLSHSSYMGMLGEYGVGLGTLTGRDVVADASAPLGQFQLPIWGWYQSFTISVPTNTMVANQQIETMLTNEINQGHVPFPDGNRLYVVVLPQGIVLPNGWGGFHSTFTYTNGSFSTSVAYAAIGHNSLALTPFQQQTEIASHELAEAVTDPTGQGWRDYTHPASDGWWEIGDGDVDGVYGYFNGYAVQKIWLNSLGEAFLPASDAVASYGTDPNALGPATQSSYNGENYLDATVGFTTYRNWEIAPGDYSGWFPVDTVIPQFVDGPGSWTWDWQASSVNVWSQSIDPYSASTAITNVWTAPTIESFYLSGLMW